MLVAPLGATAAKPAHVSIGPWGKGVLGIVTGGPAKCREGRRVAVFRESGSRPRPGTDRRIGSSRTESGKGPAIWYLETNAKGSLYAKTRREAGCGSQISHSRSETGLKAGPGDNDGYPPCSPYVSEGTSPICKLSTVGMRCGGPSFTRSSDICTTAGSASGRVWMGSFPWGLAGDGQSSSGRLEWGPRSPDSSNPDGRNLAMYTFPWQSRMDNPVAYIKGTLPGPASADFHVSDAWGRGDSGANSGDHFFTPNVPGQRAGEIGGPLYLDFQGYFNFNDVLISGYLYLK